MSIWLIVEHYMYYVYVTLFVLSIGVLCLVHCLVFIFMFYTNYLLLLYTYINICILMDTFYT